MEILVTNDDGWGAKGIRTLVRLMQRLGHVTVVAPDSVRSGMSNAITFDHLLMDKVEEDEGKVVYTTNGTPSDCVKLALHIVYEGEMKPDLIVSGINHGSNSAINVIYSGTMGAVFVGAENGVRSIGFSLNSYDPDADFSHFEPYVLEITKRILQLPDVPYGKCWNVNAPDGEIKGMRLTRQCKGWWNEEVAEMKDEEGNTYYKLGGAFENYEPKAQDTDEWALANGYVAVTPSTIDTTWHERSFR